METSSVAQVPRSRKDSSNVARRSSALPTLGFLVADASLKSFSANHEAVAILTYPGMPQVLTASFDEKIRRRLLRAQHSTSNENGAPRVIQFKSGRRTYFGRAFVLNEGRASNHATVLIVLERGISASLALSQVFQQFRLTQREQEVVTVLLDGLGNKEMADRMRVSPNTVKAFLRLVMVKMGVSSRSGIVAKVLDMVLCSQQLGVKFVRQ